MTSDIDGLLTHCYDLLLQKPALKKGEHLPADDAEELCACAKLVEHSEEA